MIPPEGGLSLACPLSQTAFGKGASLPAGGAGAPEGAMASRQWDTLTGAGARDRKPLFQDADASCEHGAAEVVPDAEDRSRHGGHGVGRKVGSRQAAGQA